jgi:hypothetical protein
MFIYKITNTINKKVYIGQTRQKRPISRWHEHISTAKKGKHYNTYLQAAFHN